MKLPHAVFLLLYIRPLLYLDHLVHILLINNQRLIDLVVLQHQPGVGVSSFARPPTTVPKTGFVNDKPLVTLAVAETGTGALNVEDVGKPFNVLY